MSTNDDLLARIASLDTAQYELMAVKATLDKEWHDAMEAVRLAEAKVAQIAKERESMRVARIVVGRTLSELRARAAEDPNEDGVTLAEALLAPPESPPDPTPPEPEPEPEPDPTPPPPQPKLTEGGGKYDIDEVRVAARELGIFNSGRLADVTGIPRTSISNYVNALMDEGTLIREGGVRGPGVYWVHKDYTGVRSAAASKGNAPPALESRDESRLRDWIIQQGDASPFFASKAAAALNVDAEAVGNALRKFEKGNLVKQKAGGRWVYVSPLRRARAA